MLQYYNYFRNYNQNVGSNNRDTRFYLALQGLSKGNMDANLYDNFSNYVPRELPYSKEMELRAYNFAIVDLGLYLNTHPNDSTVKTLYDQYVAKYNELEKVLEQQNGMYCLTSKNDDKVWTWSNSFPWERGI